jgi:hypothetical protein
MRKRVDANNRGAALAVRAAHFAMRASLMKRAPRRSRRTGSGRIEPVAPAATLLDVACMLADCFISDAAVLAAATLVDVMRNKVVTIADLCAEFPDRVVMLVSQASPNYEQSSGRRQRTIIENMPHITSEARLIHLASALCQLETLCVGDGPPHWTLERIRYYFIWVRVLWCSVESVGCHALEARLGSVLATNLIMYCGRPVAVATNALLKEYGADEELSNSDIAEDSALDYYYERCDDSRWAADDTTSSTATSTTCTDTGTGSQ